MEPEDPPDEVLLVEPFVPIIPQAVVPCVESITFVPVIPQAVVPWVESITFVPVIPQVKAPAVRKAPKPRKPSRKNGPPLTRRESKSEARIKRLLNKQKKLAQQVQIKPNNNKTGCPGQLKAARKHNQNKA